LLSNLEIPEEIQSERLIYVDTKSKMQLVCLKLLRGLKLIWILKTYSGTRS